MFSKLSSLFDRNFAIGSFLPVSVFLVANLWLVNALGYLPKAIAFDKLNHVDTLIGTTMMGLISWFLGVLLVALNRTIFRILEGYGSLNPARLFIFWFYKRRYALLVEEQACLDTKFKTCVSQGQTLPAKDKERRGKIMRILAGAYPDDERWLLPTAFGNTMRAFEVYSRIMYGFDAIPGWTRLLTIVPDKTRALVDDSKSQVDFWVNVWALSILFTAEIAFAGLEKKLNGWLGFGTCTLSIAVIASWRARSAAAEWGELVKACFDVYLPQLWDKLGFLPSSRRNCEIETWRAFTQAVLYRLPETMPPKQNPMVDRDADSSNDQGSGAGESEDDDNDVESEMKLGI